MPDAVLRVALLTPTTRRGSGAAITRWLAAHVDRRDDLALDVVDLAALGLPSVHAPQSGPAVDAYRDRIARADAFVVVTPEHNHGYPAAIKQAIDLPYREWRAKPVAFVSHGGVGGGIRAVEQLRQVFAELRTTTIRDTVSFHRVREQVDADGALHPTPGCESAVARMLDELTWWGAALRAARAPAWSEQLT